MAHDSFERIFSFFPNFVPKIPEKIVKGKTKRQRSKLLDSPNSARMAREGSAGNRGVLLALDVSGSASRRLASISVLGLRALSFKLTVARIEYASEQELEVRQAGSLTSYFPQIFENFAPRFPENVIGAKLRLSLLTVAEIR